LAVTEVPHQPAVSQESTGRCHCAFQRRLSHRGLCGAPRLDGRTSGSRFRRARAHFTSSGARLFFAGEGGFRNSVPVVFFSR